MKAFLSLALIFVAINGYSQLKVSGSTSLTVEPGTTITLDSPVADTFEVGSSATVINNGLIHLGDSVVISEQPGNPIAGNGYESFDIPSGTFSGNPGNLGFEFTNPVIVPAFQIQRWHNSIQIDQSGNSVARVFKFDPQFTLTSAPYSFYYDQTELGPLTESDLISYNQTSPGTWVNYGGNADVVADVVQNASGTEFREITLTDHPAASTGEVTFQNNLEIYPNPAGNFIFLTAPSSGEFTVFNQMGSKILSFQNSQGTVRVDLSNLSQGNYLVVWTNGKEILNRKISIIH